mgnify:CR=1 FL=1
MKEKIKASIEFYLLATKLKYKIRSGWDKNHWNVDSKRIESIAEHVYGTCILAISLNSEFELNLDMEKLLTMLAIHEIGEVLIGDITPFDKITPTEKLELEHKAMKAVLGDLVKKDELISLLSEFDERKTKEAIFAFGLKILAKYAVFIAAGCGPANTIEAPIIIVVASTKVIAKSPKLPQTISYFNVFIPFWFNSFFSKFNSGRTASISNKILSQQIYS